MTGPGGGYQVYVDALRAYGKNVAEYQNQGDRFSDLISEANVGNQSWGVVGLFTKDEYDQARTELVSLVDNMKASMHTLSYKIKEAADVYDGIEEDRKTAFGGKVAELDGPLG